MLKLLYKLSWVALGASLSYVPSRLVPRRSQLNQSWTLQERTPWDYASCQLHISPNAPCLSPKFCITRSCFWFFLGIKTFPREIENWNAYAKFWVANKVHFGKCKSCEYKFQIRDSPHSPCSATYSWRTKIFKSLASRPSFASFLSRSKGFVFFFNFTLFLGGIYLKVKALSVLFFILTSWHWPHLKDVAFFYFNAK